MDDLVGRAKDGDSAAFERLYREHVGRVYALCLRMAGSQSQAEEITQDVFVNAWRKLRTFRGDSAFSSWLHRIAVNTVLQRRRSDWRRESRLAARQNLTARPNSAGEADRAGIGIDLERALRSLPAGARHVFVLHDIEGYKHAEIAELTGLAVGTLKAQLHRARRLLREALER